MLATNISSVEGHAALDGPLTGGVTMMEDIFFIERCISQYRVMLKLLMSRESRGVLLRLLAEAEHRLVVANELHAYVT
jgi:hypothetical protein